MIALQLTGRHQLPFRSGKGAFIRMDQSGDLEGLAPSDGAEAASARRVQRLAPGLAVASSPLRLAQDSDPIPHLWSAGLADLTCLLGAGTAFVPAPEIAAPVFALWAGWSAAAFQNGGCAGLPDAQFVASYCINHGTCASQGRGGVDVVLVPPLPATCDAGEGGLPGIGTLRAMILAAVAEGRERIAIIAMPELRSIVFILLAETSGVRGPWPMLWHKRGVRRVTSKVRGEVRGEVK